MLKYAEIALNVPLNQTFTYLTLAEGTDRVSLKGENLQPDLLTKTRKSTVKNFESQIGKRAEVKFGNRRLTGIIVKLFDELPKDLPYDASKIRPIIRVLDEEPLLTSELINLGIWMSNYYLTPIGEILNSMIPSGKRETSSQDFSFTDEFPEQKIVTLSDEQKKAIESITSSNNETVKFHYLYGTTGSGKTEVFLQVAEKILKKGKGIIYLVPEIGLTPQVIEAVTMRFGSTVAVLHSGLTPSQKLTEWNRILHKEARIVIGARSAVFAPVPQLGLIIIDEEHDGSYKSNNTPRYHARQIAMYRCSKLAIPLLMGSATPSVESWNSISNGQFECHKLTKRLAGGAPPKIKIIDLSKQPSSGQSISQELFEAIDKAVAKKRQAILFLNRRGFNHFFRCSYCGYELKCKNCSVPLTYHKSINRLKCHYCGWSLEAPNSCPQCGSFDVGYSGFGTEFIEAEVKAKFPNARVVRVDTDSLTKKGELQDKLDAFKKGEYDIMLGTQMIAKGLNFPNLKVVGIVLADTGLHLPDFRASEKTFALITQVAGRAGRFFPDGEVYVQTYNPGAESIYYACNAKVNEFYSSEISTRKLLEFPPFSRLVRLVFRSPNLEDAKSTAHNAKQILEEQLSELKKKFSSLCADVEILGESECPINKIAANYRYQIILKSKNINILQRMTDHLINDFTHPSNVYIETDIDPVNLL
ncbi:primosomal protein N' [Treponema sp.]|uniref:replication restart helicase PriA n=1 Tax=Treponema sp. TaxID=166 RepID=UPI0039A0FEF8